MFSCPTSAYNEHSVWPGTNTDCCMNLRNDGLILGQLLALASGQVSVLVQPRNMSQIIACTLVCASLKTMAAKKRQALSLKRKLEIIDVLENSKKSKRQLAEELGVPRSTLYDIWNEKEKIKEWCSSETDSLDLERQWTASHTEVGKGLLDWLRYARWVNIL